MQTNPDLISMCGLISTVVFPLPIELMKVFDKLVEIGGRE